MRRYLTNLSISEPAYLCIMGAVVLAPFVLLGVYLVRDHRNFMSDCTVDLKEYECTAMWRAGRGSVSPVFIPKP